MELGDDDASGEEVLDARQQWLQDPYTKKFLLEVNAARVDAERNCLMTARSADPNYTAITRFAALGEAFQLVLDAAGVKKKSAVAAEAMRTARGDWKQLEKRK